jgi:hypothetical protein
MNISKSSTNNHNQNDIQNFSKLLRKLEMENVNIDEIRILKT